MTESFWNLLPIIILSTRIARIVKRVIIRQPEEEVAACIVHLYHFGVSRESTH